MPRIGAINYVNLAFLGNTQLTHVMLGKFIDKLLFGYDRKYMTIISTIPAFGEKEVDNLSTYCALNLIPHVERYLVDGQTYKTRNKLLLEYPVDSVIVFPGYCTFDAKEEMAIEDMIEQCEANHIPIYHADIKDFS